MEIKVADEANNRLVRMEVNPDSTVRSIINSLRDSLQIPPRRDFRLSCKGTELNGNAIVSDWGIHEGDPLRIVWKAETAAILKTEKRKERDGRAAPSVPATFLRRLDKKAAMGLTLILLTVAALVSWQYLQSPSPTSAPLSQEQTSPEHVVEPEIGRAYVSVRYYANLNQYECWLGLVGNSSKVNVATDGTIHFVIYDQRDNLLYTEDRTVHRTGFTLREGQSVFVFTIDGNRVADARDEVYAMASFVTASGKYVDATILTYSDGQERLEERILIEVKGIELNIEPWCAIVYMEPNQIAFYYAMLLKVTNNGPSDVAITAVTIFGATDIRSFAAVRAGETGLATKFIGPPIPPLPNELGGYRYVEFGPIAPGEAVYLWIPSDVPLVGVAGKTEVNGRIVTDRGAAFSFDKEVTFVQAY